MDTTARLQILRRHGFTHEVAAAIVGADLDELAAEALDPSDVPSIGGPGAAAPNLTPVADGGDLQVFDVDIPIGVTGWRAPTGPEGYPAPWAYVFAGRAYLGGTIVADDVAGNGNIVALPPEFTPAVLPAESAWGHVGTVVAEDSGSALPIVRLSVDATPRLAYLVLGGVGSVSWPFFLGLSGVSWAVAAS